MPWPVFLLRQLESDNLEATTWKRQLASYNLEATTWKRQLGSDNLEETTWKRQLVTLIGFRTIVLYIHLPTMLVICICTYSRIINSFNSSHTTLTRPSRGYPTASHWQTHISSPLANSCCSAVGIYIKVQVQKVQVENSLVWNNSSLNQAEQIWQIFYQLQSSNLNCFHVAWHWKQVSDTNTILAMPR